jgi:hypothetical protein
MDCARHYVASSNQDMTDPHLWRDVWMTSLISRFQTISRTGWTYPVPGIDPLDEAEDIPSLSVPHFTRGIN